ncbi:MULTISPECIES: fatty acid desaturase [unclassified Polaromonas]|jgi:stearoyl-CoA desaturase (delta-9 desaturase)|uniref:DesA family fatty acid desaturase n=1 Tax=unclassified Polaromonas TaxID=2638319 RepID=UPI000BC779EF|nr:MULTISPECIES: fatty acid desaturase [unclassified Polaromonas]OYY33790.1 MAG: acyl-CoA desaturase [Polaromonas sp. 35-63-35]OYZ19452.1 MAG: acyl-CoA desaturase [Polaromonas sp. 16-63-31]OYZ77363.1 MAG: acyl-CoA desaturase [Polaromonas sp. 24-63-21]OZA48335.1 MAG: acyl-CoA desaturase [Polaromonas sp. 17-63-33]OZA86602.1 MAG: acyl-CoA desaturase [Polaromonas sp. 39-63-25]
MVLFDAALDWLANGLLAASWWQIVLYTLVTTHITIASVTIYLHRHQAHRAMDLHPIPSHFFRFWLWLGTGQVTKEWVSIHRKHHAKCETSEDPHSPQAYGIKKVFWEGAELYRAESKNMETMVKYGHGTPNDWIERNLYTRYSWQGVGLMLVINLALFGAAGLAVWAVQMIWIPVTAAGIINGIGHYWGYRNFEAPDASTNVSPWGVIIGGEELHNNHHTYPTSAKFSVKPYEFDIGWVYIRAMEKVGLATVKKVPPRLQLGDIQPVADEKTLEALIAHRYEVMAGFARELRRAGKAEIEVLKARKADISVLQAANRWLHRDDDKVPAAAKPQVAQARAEHPVLDKMVTMREELRQMWLSRSASREQLATDLQAWCRRAEESGIAALQEFSMKLRAARA